MNLQTINGRVFVSRTELIKFLEQQYCTFQYYNRGIAVYRAPDGTLGQLYPMSELRSNLYDVTRFTEIPVNELDHDNDYYGMGGREDDGMIVLDIPEIPADAAQPEATDDDK